MAENVTKKKLYVEGVGDVVSVVLFLVTLPVVSAAFLNVLKTLIVLIMPKRFFDKKMGYKKGTIRFDNPKRSHLTVQRNPEELPPNNFLYTTVFPMVEWIVDKIDNLAKKYIDVLVFILKKIPKMKTKNDNELRHIAITIYYTITVGLLMKVIKILLYKKGLIGDGTALKSIRDLIINGLKFGSYDLDFDDIEKDSDVIFSNKGVAPIMKELTDNFLRQFHITEDTYNHMNNNTLNETFQRHLKLLHKKLNESMSIEDLAKVSDEALDNAYHYGRSTPGNTFGWQANLKSAEFAKREIDKGITDIEKIADAIHSGWNETAKKFVENPDQFDDTKKLRDSGKLEAKIEQRRKLSNVSYSSLPEEEKEKDRVVARALLNALKPS